KPAAPPTAAPVVAATAQSAAQPTNTPVQAAPAVQATPTLLGDKPAPTRASTKAPTGATTTTQSASASAVGVSDVKFCLRLSGGTCAANQSNFITSTQAVFVSFAPALPEGTLFRVEWQRNGAKWGEPDTCTVTAGKCAPASPDVSPSWDRVYLPKDLGARRGTYAFKLIVGEAAVAQGQFTVK
ncbi:MAG: hypothetical protein HC853_16930, partial [Anaerolineae bacterium]|nr:hypothetical protein [Anaerolineae bacterium]